MSGVGSTEPPKSEGPARPAPERGISRRIWSHAGAGWTDELVGYALDRFHRRHLRTPTVRELRAGVGDLPSHATIRRLYGNASNMFRTHGYRIRPTGGQPGHPCWTSRRDARGLFLPNDAAAS